MTKTSLGSLLLVLSAGTAAAQPAPDLRRSELTGPPSDRVVRRDIDGDGKPDMVERWWNGKRVRWLDENGDLRPTDTRGDQVADVLQVDMDGDGTYDGVNDQNVKWADNDGDGRRGRPGLVDPAPGVGRGREVEHRRVALDALPRRREGRRPRLAGLAQVRLRRVELGARRAGQLEAGLPRRRPLPEDPPAPAGAARPAPQLGEPVRLLRHGRRRPDRDGHALARPHDARRQGPLAALGRPQRGVPDLRPRQRLGEGQRDRLRHVAARHRRARRALPLDGPVLPRPARQPEVRPLLPVGQLAPGRPALLHAPRQELRRVLQRGLEDDVLRLRRG